MKNKEIEEILKYLKNNTYIPDETKRKYKILHRDEVNLLLSYIEQLEKEYKQLKDRNEINIDRNIEAYRIVEQLENNRDKAIEYINSHFIFNDKTGECYQTHTFDKDNVKKLYDILKGDSDYE